jgi:SAM-dependent methyltransferase
MKIESEPTRQMITKGSLFKILGGFAHFELLYCACKFELFEYLHQNPGSGVNQVSNALGISDRATRTLTRGLVALKLVEEDSDGNFRNSLFAGLKLRKGIPGSLFPMIQFFHSVFYQAAHHLEDSLKTGTNAGISTLEGSGSSLYERLQQHPELNGIFHSWLDAQAESRLSLTENIGQLRGFLESSRQLLDIGGGRGRNAFDLCAHFPDLSVKLLDLELNCEVAREEAKKRGLEHRMSCQSGDFFSAPWGSGTDAVLLANVLDIFSPEENQRLLEKAFACLRPGGHLIIFSPVEGEDPDDRLMAACMSVYFLSLASGRGMIYRAKEIEAWVAKAGFLPVQQSIFGASPHLLLVATKP